MGWRAWRGEDAKCGKMGMADADFGYVGTGPGVITPYREKEVVKRNVPSEQAVDELIALIKEHGMWIDTAEG